MKRIVLLVSVAVLAAGCASQENGESTPAEEPAIEAAPAVADAMPAGTELASVTGTMGCGHCAYDVTSSCSAALQTDDGFVYILEGVDES